MNSCRVCMEPDKDQKFSSMFVDNGKNASRFFLLTGLIITEMTCAGEVLICKYCSTQLELFSLWRERCRHSEEICRNNSSDVIVTELVTKYSILEILPPFPSESPINESDTTEKLEMISSINELLENIRTAFDLSSMVESVESIISHESEPQYPYFCNENESNTTDISKSQSIKCRICNVTFKHQTKCSIHFKTQHPIDKQYQCDICMKSFKIARIFRIHMMRHESGYEELVCSMCNKRFRSKERYSCHVQKHESDLFMKLSLTNRDRENIVRSWNENNLPKFPLLVEANRK